MGLFLCRFCKRYCEGAFAPVQGGGLLDKEHFAFFAGAPGLVDVYRRFSAVAFKSDRRVDFQHGVLFVPVGGGRFWRAAPCFGLVFLAVQHQLFFSHNFAAVRPHKSFAGCQFIFALRHAYPGLDELRVHVIQRAVGPAEHPEALQTVQTMGSASMLSAEKYALKITLKSQIFKIKRVVYMLLN